MTEREGRPGEKYAGAAEEPSDPFDTERLRSASLENIAVEKITLTIPVRRPGRNEFFRVHPDPEMTVDWFVLERKDDMDREVYWVTEEFHEDLLDELKPVRIFTCINKRGTVFLWPAQLPGSDNRSGRRWHESALEIAENAENSWVKMQGNTRSRGLRADSRQGRSGRSAMARQTVE